MIFGASWQSLHQRSPSIVIVSCPGFVVGPKTERRVRNDAIVLCEVLNSFSIGVVKFGTPCREQIAVFNLHFLN